MKHNPYARVDVPKLLERLEIRFRQVGGGRRLAASCPNPEHEDKTASWFIRDNPGEPYHAAHKCQGCGFGGGPIILAKAVLGLDDDDVRGWLEDLTAPPPLPTKVELEFVERERVGAFALPPCFKFLPIGEWPDAHRTKILERVSSLQVERWGLGFVTKCKCKGKRHANRIAIPVRNERGELCAYTARAIGEARAKYVEPATYEHAKRAILGSQHWSDKKTLALVEGGFDAFAVERVAGEGLAVGALRGSNPHPVTLLRVAQFERVILMTDPDKAGQKAREAVLAACARHAEVVSVVLPVGADPAKLAETPQGELYLRNRLKSFL